MVAVGTLALELFWVADLFARLLFGHRSEGLTGYMFDARRPPWLRGLSLFHTRNLKLEILRGLCLAGVTLALFQAVKFLPLTVTGDTTRAVDDTQLSCALAGSSGRDLVYAFSVGARKR